MKKVLVLVLTFLSISAVQAQDPERTKVDFGLKGGVNLGGIEGSYDDLLSSSYKVSLHAGFYVGYPIIRDKLSMQLEVLFSGKGYKADVLDSVPQTSSTFQNSITHNQFYLDIPFLLKYNLGQGWGVHAGFQYSILIFEEYVNFVTERKEDLKVSDNDYGIVLGVAYNLDPRNEIGLRYIYGLQDIIEFQNTYTAHSSLIQAYVGFTFF